MDIKRRRRNEVETGKTWNFELQRPEGMYPETDATQGNQASDNNISWDVRAQSWQRGADSDYKAIQDESMEENTKYGVPCTDRFDNCADRNPKDGPLPNPHNFSSNPGFMGTSEMSTAGSPANGGTARIATPGAGRFPSRSPRSTGTVGATAVASQGNSVLPAPGDIDPGQEGEPLQVSSGYSG